MLYFSKTKLIVVYFLIFLFSIFSFSNFFDYKDKFPLQKKINLGLDLQGGSYLLLEVNTDPIVYQKIQNKLILLRNELKSKQIQYRNLKSNNNKITFQLPNLVIESFKEFFYNKENSLNSYYNNYKSYEMDMIV